ncbi:M23 family metallopeptidase [Dactylosporangium sp. CS-047395]|uniref:M23 family metallopeptidase n=1 Tax=Dactylosporangium sp. CS-047395 TaxID=3239936 RepID=UPI003D9345F0
MFKTLARVGLLVLAATAIAAASSAIAAASAVFSTPPPAAAAEPQAAGFGAPENPAEAPPVPGQFEAPLDGPVTVTRGFEPPSDRYAAGHRGVDLAGVPGQTVRSAGEGTVVFAGMVGGRPVVSVEHPGGVRTTYEPVAWTVVRGQAVAPGTPLGTLRPGHPSCPAPACLHWGLRTDDKVYLDPLSLLRHTRVRLFAMA